jgi:hypothetical protein
LLRSHAYGLDGELATAHVEQVFKIRSQEIDREDVVQAFLAKVMYLGNADCGPDWKKYKRGMPSVELLR